MKTQLLILTIFLGLYANNAYSQSVIDMYESFKSEKYGYSIKVPKSFKPRNATQKNTDLVLADSYGSSISINVTDRLPEEYSMSGHSFSSEMFQNGMRKVFPNYTISNSEKIYVNGEKAFLSESTGGASPKLSEMACYFFHKDKAYVITCSSETARYSNYRQLFKDVIKSFTLNN